MIKKISAQELAKMAEQAKKVSQPVADGVDSINSHLDRAMYGQIPTAEEAAQDFQKVVKGMVKLVIMASGKGAAAVVGMEVMEKIKNALVDKTMNTIIQGLKQGMQQSMKQQAQTQIQTQKTNMKQSPRMSMKMSMKPPK